MIKINQLQIENVKRVKAVQIKPTLNGITIVGGKNNQGKTSILDAIAWGLGGNKYRPSDPARVGSVIPPYLRIVLSNGLIVERKGKNADLKVIDPSGKKGGQQLLDSFVEELAIDLPKFMHATSREKAKLLLQIIGVESKLLELEMNEKEWYNHRHTIGKIADQKIKFAKEQIYFPEAPNELISASELIRQQQEILTRNGENQRKRQRLIHIQTLCAKETQEIERLTALLCEVKMKHEQTLEDLEIAQKDALDLMDESTAELEANLEQIEEMNRKVRANLDKDKAEQDAKDYKMQYDELTVQLEEVRKQKNDLLTTASLPLEGLSVEDGELMYNGQKWDNMSGSDQLRVSTSIVRKLKPDCGFILLDKLEQMDMDTLQSFGKWMEQEGLQAIATRVSIGKECSIIIEDGYVAEQAQPVETKPWKVGEF